MEPRFYLFSSLGTNPCWHVMGFLEPSYEQGHKSSLMVECKQTKNCVKQTWTLIMVRCGFHALNVANLKAMVNMLQRIYFKT